MGCSFDILPELLNGTEELLFNLTPLPKSEARIAYDHMVPIIKGILLPVIFSFGLMGNALNIAVFAQKRLRSGLDKIELSATIGLLSLSVSDLLFCFAGFPAVFMDKVTSAYGNELRTIVAFYYTTYKVPVMNLFLFTSTWLIVLVAVERYVAVCHPFTARCIIKVRRTVASQAVVCFISLVINLPVFFMIKVEKRPCGTCTCLGRKMIDNEVLLLSHRILWFILGTIIPLVILTFCNVRILYELYKSSKRGIAEAEAHSTSRITLIMVTMIFMFLLMVCPSMFLEFSQSFIDMTTKSDSFMQSFRIAILLSNLTQAIKFACNFLLYCSINKKFRETVSKGRCAATTTTKSSSANDTSNKYHLVELTSQKSHISSRGDTYYS